MEREETRLDLGGVSVSPAEVTPGEEGTWRMVFKAGRGGLRKCAVVRFELERGFVRYNRGSTRRLVPQIDDPSREGFCKLECSRAGAKFSLDIGPTFPELINLHGFKEATALIEREASVRRRASYNRGVHLFARLEEGELKEGDELVLVLGEPGPEGAGRAIYHPGHSQDIVEFGVSVDPDGKGSAPYSGFFRAGEPARVPLRHREVSRVLAVAPSLVEAGESFTVKAVKIDRDGRPLGRLEEAAEIGPVKPGEHVAPEVKLAGIRAGANPVACTVDRDRPPYKLFWGDLHIHCAYGDGPRDLTPERTYELARQTYGLDFACLTPHDSELVYMIGPDEWEEMKRAAAEAYEPGSFVTLLGYEYTERAVDGDRNVYFPTLEGPLLRHVDEGSRTPVSLWEKLRELGAMTVPHHSVTEWIGSTLTFHDPQVERLIEIFSCHGSSEGPGARRRTRAAGRPLFRADFRRRSVSAALLRGYRLGIIASGDTHDARLGEHGKCAVWARELTREAVWEALWKRRCYGTTRGRIVLWFELGGEPMGSETVRREGERLDFRLRLVGSNSFEEVTVLKNERPLETWRDVGDELEVELEDIFTIRPGAAAANVYRVRAVQADGEIAWSSPIWVGAAQSA